MRYAFLFSYIAFLALTGCQGQEMERKFYQDGPRTREARLGGYTIQQQWRIYLYGNQKIHPPSGPALQLAEQGEPMMRYILKQLRTSQNDLDFRDSLEVFMMMEGHGNYNICNDAAAVMEVRQNQYKIEDADWRSFYGSMLQWFCTEKSVYKQRQRLRKLQAPKL
jgi:hypothetical protein